MAVLRGPRAADHSLVCASSTHRFIVLLMLHVGHSERHPWPNFLCCYSEHRGSTTSWSRILRTCRTRCWVASATLGPPPSALCHRRPCNTCNARTLPVGWSAGWVCSPPSSPWFRTVSELPTTRSGRNGTDQRCHGSCASTPRPACSALTPGGTYTHGRLQRYIRSPGVHWQPLFPHLRRQRPQRWRKHGCLWKLQTAREPRAQQHRRRLPPVGGLPAPQPHLLPRRHVHPPRPGLPHRPCCCPQRLGPHQGREPTRLPLRLLHHFSLCLLHHIPGRVLHYIPYSLLRRAATCLESSLPASMYVNMTCTSVLSRIISPLSLRCPLLSWRTKAHLPVRSKDGPGVRHYVRHADAQLLYKCATPVISSTFPKRERVPPLGLGCLVRLPTPSCWLKFCLCI